MKTFMTLFLISELCMASVRALFHPHAPTLQVIAKAFDQAQSSAQIAMYNIDVTDQSPLIAYLKSPAFQNKLKKGFKAQIIFEGYGTPAENKAKLQALENLGLDARYLGVEQKVHHKFAILDAGSDTERLITGSANWSLSSMNNYDENIFFMENEPGITSQFMHEFSLLWENSREFGKILFPDRDQVIPYPLKGDLHAFFNSHNYNWDQGHLQKIDELKPELTQTLVRAIDKAQNQIDIATTRIKLAPVYAALMKAAKRGVKIKIVVSQAEYLSANSRAKNSVKECGRNLYDPACSSGMNFSPLLDSQVTGFENMQIRLKFFNLDLSENIQQQMHNKYMIIDRKWILSGSFNWSNSSEWQHIENIVVVDGEKHREVLADFEANFKFVWNMNREKSSVLLQNRSCHLMPSVLSFQEIDKLRQMAFAQKICVNQ